MGELKLECKVCETELDEDDSYLTFEKYVICDHCSTIIATAVMSNIIFEHSSLADEDNNDHHSVFKFKKR